MIGDVKTDSKNETKTPDPKDEIEILLKKIHIKNIQIERIQKELLQHTEERTKFNDELQSKLSNGQSIK